MININYKTKTALTEEIYSHLKECNENFIPPLEEKVNIMNYSRKIFENAITFEAWDEKILVGLIATYLNDTENKSAFITNVSTIKSYMGKGIANELMKMCINYSKNHNFKVVNLEVSSKNADALNLYLKYGFVKNKVEDSITFMRLILNK